MEGRVITPGAESIIIPAGIYLSGDLIVQGDPNLLPENIKKNVPIFSVIGTHNGYVAEATDLYLKENNVKNWMRNGGGTISFDQECITLTSTRFVRLNSGAAVNSTGCTRINLSVRKFVMYNNRGRWGYLYVQKRNSGTQIGMITVDYHSGFNGVISIPILSINEAMTIFFDVEQMGYSYPIKGIIDRIWLS